MGINLLNSVFCMTIFSRVKMGTPVAVLLGHFSVGPSAAQPKEEDDAPICATTEHEEAIPKSEVINDEESVDNISVHEQKDQIVEKYITALRNVFSLIREVEPSQISLWKRTICQLIYSSTVAIETLELSNDKESLLIPDGNCLNFDLGRTNAFSSYVSDLLPELKLDQFLQICFALELFTELGELFFDSEEQIENVGNKIVELFRSNHEKGVKCLAQFVFSFIKSGKAKENEKWKKLNGSTGFFTNEHFDAKLSDLLYQFELIFNEEFNSILLDLAKYRALFEPQMKYSPSFNELLVKITKDVSSYKSLLDAVFNLEFLQVNTEFQNTHKQIHGRLSMKVDEFCFVAGIQNLIANDPLEVIESVKISDDYRDIKTDVDILINSVKYFVNDYEKSFCSLVEIFAAIKTMENENFDQIFDIIQKYLPYISSDDVLKLFINLTMIPKDNALNNRYGTNLAENSVCMLRNLFFNVVLTLPFSDGEHLRLYLYAELQAVENYLEWSRFTADLQGFTLNNLTEIFNRLNPKDLQEKTESVSFLSRCSFVIPDRIVEKAVHEAFASRGKTMLIQQLFQKFPSLLQFVLKPDKLPLSEAVPFILKAIESTNVSNANSACQFVRFLADRPEVTPDQMFNHGIIPKYSGNKVNAVKLISAILPLLKEEKYLYASILDRFFNKNHQTGLTADDKWFFDFRRLGFEEFVEVADDANRSINYRDIMIGKGADKFSALVEFFKRSCLILLKIAYNTSNLEIKNIPEFLSYNPSEISVCAFHYLTSNVNALDVRTFAVCLKLLMTLSLFKKQSAIDAVTKSSNMIVWKIIVNAIKLCLSCKDVKFHPNLLESLPTIVKGILKWLKLEIDENQNGLFGQLDLLYCCLYMLRDILSCCILCFKQKEEILFRDCYYLMIDQLQLLSQSYSQKQTGAPNNPLNHASNADIEVTCTLLKKFYSEQIVIYAKRCAYSLPGNLAVHIMSLEN